jgi:hypothetical protein
MPYEGELASKSAHSDIIKNPEIQAFLNECSYLTPPSSEECEKLAAQFSEVPPTNNVRLPSFAIAVDGSPYEASLDEQLPSTKIGYIKLGAILIDLEDFAGLKVGKYVDPFRVAQLQDNNSSFTFFVPSANIRWGGKQAVRDSFRALVDRQFLDEKTRFNRNDPSTSLRTTLFHLASRRADEKLGTGDPTKLKIHKCPSCGEGPVTLQDIPEAQFCQNCGEEVYPTDCLRIWEEVSDYQSNQAAINRLMNILEHLVPIHYMRYFADQAPVQLGGIAFFVDGPLAIFGTAAWIHRSIMIYLQEINERLKKHNIPPILMIGLQKSGQVVDHVNFIDRFLPNNRLFAIDDDYRYKYILAGREASKNGFGFETYYGQDFIYKTPTGRTFVFGLPYPYDSKSPTGLDFIKEKVQFKNYLQLPRAIKLIDHFESDLYENAVIPIALAHHYTAISLEPGGRVLDLLTKKGLNKS